MKKYNILIVLVLFYLSCRIENTYQKLIDDGLLESLNETFKSINNSESYIYRYELNEDEINNIGCWSINQFVDQKYIENGGLGITVTFFPNRMFRAYKDHAGMNDIQYVFGEWKVENKILYIKLVTKAVIISDTKWNFIMINSPEYYSILKIPKYTYAYINTRSYNFKRMPTGVIDFFEINKTDLPRSRLIFDTLGDPPGDLSIGSVYEKILNIRSFNSEYLEQLINIW